MSNYLIVALSLTIAISAILVSYLYASNKQLGADNKVLEKNNEIQVKQLDSHSRRPRIDDDVIDQLCQWAKTLSREQGKTLPTVPNSACN